MGSYYLTFTSSEGGNATVISYFSILLCVKIVWRTSLAFQCWNTVSLQYRLCISLCYIQLSHLEKEYQDFLWIFLQSKTNTQIVNWSSLPTTPPATVFASLQQGLILQTHITHLDSWEENFENAWKIHILWGSVGYLKCLCSTYVFFYTFLISCVMG